MTQRNLFDKLLSGLIVAALPVVGSTVIYLNTRIDDLYKMVSPLTAHTAAIEMAVFGKTLTFSDIEASSRKPSEDGKRLLP